MSRFIKILGLHMQRVFEQRGKLFIWLFMAFVNPFILILFWRGALDNAGGSINSWTEADFNSYYLVLIVLSNILVMHIEENIAFHDVRLGSLAGYLVRPFSYYWAKFYHEIPYRILEGAFAICLAILIFPYLQKITFFEVTTQSLLFVSTIILFALFISFTFKMIIGLFSLWLTQIDGLEHTLFILGLVFGGFVVPLEMLPPMLKSMLFITPFPWITYYPVVAVQGKLDAPHMLGIIAQQAVWLLGLYLTYKLVWRAGVKKFTAVGQ